jgi:predicted nucleotidyltransferase
MESDRQELDALVATMKRAAAALRDAEIPFMLGGGLAAWARGGPRTDHDVDFFVEEADAERAQQALVEAGMKPERPTEEWLLKAHDGDVLVDLIFKPSGDPIGPEYFQRANELEVMGQTVLVASIDDVLVTKLLALNEQELDFQPVLAMARSLREQIDWEYVRERSDGSPFARAFFTLAEELGIDGSDRRLTPAGSSAEGSQKTR